MNRKASNTHTQKIHIFCEEVDFNIQKKKSGTKVQKMSILKHVFVWEVLLRDWWNCIIQISAWPYLLSVWQQENSFRAVSISLLRRWPVHRPKSKYIIFNVLGKCTTLRTHWLSVRTFGPGVSTVDLFRGLLVRR